MKPVKVYQPEFQVKLFKTVKRSSVDGKAVTADRFRGSVEQTTIDLTPFLGEGSAVRTSKAVNQAAGGFQITVCDKPHIDGSSLETLYGLIEPMDMIEIRARHVFASSGKPPIIMRGFVSDVSRNEAMSSDGRPSRSVSISGQDYGKVWQIMRIIFYVDMILGEAYISEFRLFEKFGVGFETALPVEKFFNQVFEKCINPFLAGMLPENFPLPRKIVPKVLTKHGTTSPGIQSQQGSFYELLRYFCDVGAWNEMFMEDTEEEVQCVLRPNPYMKAGVSPSQKIQSDAPEPEYVDVDDVDLLSLSVSRSDSNVANYYWVRAPRFEMAEDFVLRQWAVAGDAAKKRDGTVVLADYTNSLEKLYGTRVMDFETALGEDTLTTHNLDDKSAGLQKQAITMNQWIDERRRILVEQNKDNVIFERGSMRLRGNEDIKAGRYVRLRRGSFEATYYATEVSHELLPFVGWFTTVSFDRGTGFIKRIQSSGSPYLGELSQ